MRGEVVGVVLPKLSATKVFRLTGDMPENVNYAIKIGYLRMLLDSAQPSGQSRTTARTPADLSTLAARIKPGVVFVEAAGGS